jgi:cysteine synthase B
LPVLPKLLAPAPPDSLIARVGRTPMVRLQSITRGVVPSDVEIWCKLEWFNPGGSIKDRAALSMVHDAERRGLLGPGGHILEASSGNTGIALAWIAACRGYKLTLCLPANANEERKRTLRAHGVEVILTDPLEGSDGAIHRARELVAAHPERYVYLDQYSNDANWKAHFDGTGPEIWSETVGRVTDFVSTLGTSGTFMGTSRFLKEQSARVRCHAVQPDSPFHGLEGMKHMESAMVPQIYLPDGLVDSQLGAPTEKSYELVRRLAREEGLLTGISSGAAVWAALEIGRQLDHGLVVAVLPDGGGRYLSEAHLWEAP